MIAVTPIGKRPPGLLVEVTVGCPSLAFAVGSVHVTTADAAPNGAESTTLDGHSENPGGSGSSRRKGKEILVHTLECYNYHTTILQRS